MSKTEHDYANALRWIADGETVELLDGHSGWMVGDARTLLSIILKREAKPEDFRLKPRTISINGHEVPEPMRVKPAFGAKYYVPYLQVACENPFDELTWYAEDGDRFRLNLGICHATREAAEAHARALLSFTTTEQP